MIIPFLTIKRISILVVIVAALIVAFGIFASDASAQVPNPLDSNEHVSTLENFENSVSVSKTSIGRTTVDGSVWVVIEVAGNTVESRAADVLETAAYEGSERLVKIGKWVNNRATELQTCETDAQAGLGLSNFTLMTPGQKNAVITSLLECQELNSKVNRKTMVALLNILQANDLSIE